MRISIYSFVAFFINLPFRDPFRENPLPLPGSLRDSAFSLFGMFWWHFPKTIDGENEEESASSSKKWRSMLSASIVTYLATWRLNGESCPGLLAWPSTLRTCRNIMPSSPSICSFWLIAPQEQLLGFSLLDTLPVPFRENGEIISDTFWIWPVIFGSDSFPRDQIMVLCKTYSGLGNWTNEEKPSGTPSGKTHFPFREASGTAGFCNVRKLRGNTSSNNKMNSL